MPHRQTERAVAGAAPLETAPPAGEAARPRPALELGPRPDAVAAGPGLIRRGLHVR